jgi:non-ribosomal peptide synthetase-like protein
VCFDLQMVRLAKAHVFAAIDRAAAHILTARPEDDRINRAYMCLAIARLRGAERSLTEILFQLAHQRGAGPGTITKTNVKRALVHAKSRLSDPDNVDGTGLSDDEMATTSTIAMLAAEMAREQMFVLDFDQHARLPQGFVPTLTLAPGTIGTNSGTPELNGIPILDLRLQSLIAATLEILGEQLPAIVAGHGKLEIGKWSDPRNGLVYTVCHWVDNNDSSVVLYLRDQGDGRWRLGRERDGGSGLLHQLFEESAARFPERPALQCGDTHWTYAELNRRANRFARYLRESGIGPGAIVGLQLMRGPDAYVCILGVLKAGAAYLPLDPDTPGLRVEEILEDAGARCLVTQRALADKFDARPNCPVMLFDEARERVARASASPLPVEVRPDDLCYVTYTSGSTGRPKSVAMQHRAARAFVEGAREVYALDPTDRVYQGVSLAFDASVEEIWMAFANGAALVVSSSDAVRSGAGLAEFLEREQVTCLSTVPTLLANFEGDLPTIRLLILSGERCPQALGDRWTTPWRRVLNTYRPSEAAVVTTWHECAPGRELTIGRPLPCYQVHILDADLQPVRGSQPGELCITGPALARGDVNVNSDASDASDASEFVTLRLHRDREPAQLYRSGDLARWTEAGEIQLLGARDEALQQLPMQPSSGKVDRGRSPDPTELDLSEVEIESPATTPIERVIADVWARALGRPDVSINDNFFLDLSGHSLIAARVVSELRRNPTFADIAVQQIYDTPTVRRLAEHFGAVEQPEGARSPVQASPAPSVAPVRRQAELARRHAIFTVAQFVSMYVILLASFSALLVVRELLLAWPWFVALGPWQWQPLVALLVLSPLVLPVSVVLAVSSKWILIGRFKPGRHPLWGLYHLRLWLASGFQLAPLAVLAGTPWMNVYLRLMGARVAPDAWLGSADVAAPDLLSIGPGASVSTDCHIRAIAIEAGEIRLGPINIGADCFVGTQVTLGIDTHMDVGARIEAMSMLPEGSTIPAGETWRGSPAYPVDAGQADAETAAAAAIPHGPIALLRYAAIILVMQAWLIAIAAPAVALVYGAIFFWDWNWLAWTPVAALVGVVSMMAGITVCRWLVLRRTQPGSYRVSGSLYLRKWIFDTFLQTSLTTLRCLYATLYVIPWLRTLGAKIGERVEVATASRISPTLLTMKAGSFAADASILGASRVEKGWMRLAQTHIGARSFIGNSALVPAGTHIGGRCSLGIMSVPPPGATLPPETDWLGSPSFRLPRRQQDVSSPESRTYAPPPKMYAARLVIEAFRVSIPPTVLTIVGAFVLTLIPAFFEHGIGTGLLFALPVLFGLLVCTVALVPLVLKWALIRRYRPGASPLWSSFVWRTELVTGVYEALAVPGVFSVFGGTPLAAIYLRLLGAKIGKRVVLGTTNFSEFDLVHVGDDTILNLGSTVQTHLFEDRILKMDHVRIGPRCTVGIDAVVLYDTLMEPDTALMDVSLMMKGERFPQATKWEGVPSRRCMRTVLASQAPTLE